MHTTLFEIGSFVIHTYGIVVMLACLLFVFMVRMSAARHAFYTEEISNLALLLIIAGIFGARVFHVIINPLYYYRYPGEIFMVWKGGLAFQGGLVAGVIAFLVFTKKKKMPLAETADLFAPYIALGHAFGRIGCFLNGCCFGKGEGIFRYPVQLYASLALIAIFVALRIIQEKRFFSGCTISLFFFLHATQRFFMDFLRGDNPTYFLGLTVGQFVGIATIVCSVILFKIYYTKQHGKDKN